MSNTTIYALCDPDTEEIHYIGRARNPRKRFHGHIVNSKDKLNTCPSSSWIRSLIAKGKKPKMISLDKAEP